jgi:hypothetical protein
MSEISSLVAEIDETLALAETDAGRIASEQLFESLEATEALIDRLESAAAKADVSLGTEWLEVSTADTIDWRGLVTGVGSVLDELSAPWQYRVAWAGLGQLAWKLYAIVAQQYGPGFSLPTAGYPLPVALRRITATAQLTLVFRTRVETALGEFLCSLGTGGSTTSAAYAMLDRLYGFEAAIWAELDALEIEDGCASRRAIARERRALAHSVRAYERGFDSDEPTETVDKTAVLRRLVSMLETIVEQEAPEG